jgi:hypothetical protein
VCHLHTRKRSLVQSPVDQARDALGRPNHLHHETLESLGILGRQQLGPQGAEEWRGFYKLRQGGTLKP